MEGYRKARTEGHTRAKVRCNREVSLLRTLYARLAAWGLGHLEAFFTGKRLRGGHSHHPDARAGSVASTSLGRPRNHSKREMNA